MMPIENTQEFRSVGSAVGASKRFFFAHSLHAACKWPKWPDQGPSNGAVIFFACVQTSPISFVAHVCTQAIIFYDARFSAKLRSCRFATS